jgi:hypothetical protein
LGFQNHIDGNIGILGGDARMPVLDSENTSGEAREKKGKKKRKKNKKRVHRTF